VNPTQPGVGFLSSLKPIVEAGLVFSALAFAAGWSCLYSYYNQFGLGLFDLDIPFAVASIFAIRVLLRSAWPLSLLVVGIGLFGLARWRQWGISWLTQPRRDIAVLILVAVAVVVLVMAGAGVGRSSATSDMYSRTTELPTVAFVSSLKSDYPLPQCLVSNTLDCLLLVHSKGAYYVLEPLSSEAQSPNILLYSVPDSQVQLMRMQRGQEK
jgi:hypothetical protein